MSLVTRAGDLVYTFRFMKLLVTNFEDTDAYKLGIIDEKGIRIKSKKVETSAEKAAYTTFHKLVFNIKKLMAKVPGGGSKLASYAAALFLIKEHLGISEKNLDKILNECGLNVIDLLTEKSEWYVLDDKMLSPGIYRVTDAKCVASTLEELVQPKDKVRVAMDAYPIDSVFGIDIYEAIHINSDQKVYITAGEIFK